MYIVPTIPHLRNLKLTMAYRELPENEAQLTKWAPTQKWKNDPDAHRFYGFAPRNKYYLNGTLVHEERPRLADVSKTPFPEKRVPRRGLTAVPPEDPDYARLCKEQGLSNLLTANGSPRLLAKSFTLSILNSIMVIPDTSSGTSRSQAAPTVTNGDTVHEDGTAQPHLPATGSRLLVNGVNGTSRGPGE